MPWIADPEHTSYVFYREIDPLILFIPGIPSAYIMTSATWKWSLSSITGMAAFIIYCGFTFTAVALYQTPYNPLYDWLSNLGNVNFNPVGSFFFNSGCILTGIILVPFFAGLYRWYEPTRWKKILLIAGQAVGIFAGVALIMVGIFPETQIARHMLAAGLMFKALFVAMVILNLGALFNHPKFMRWIGYYGIVVVFIDLAFVVVLLMFKDILGAFHTTVPVPGLEWAAVFSSLIWIGALSYNMAKSGV